MEKCSYNHKCIFYCLADFATIITYLVSCCKPVTNPLNIYWKGMCTKILPNNFNFCRIIYYWRYFSLFIFHIWYKYLHEVILKIFYLDIQDTYYYVSSTFNNKSIFIKQNIRLLYKYLKKNIYHKSVIKFLVLIISIKTK